MLTIRLFQSLLAITVFKTLPSSFFIRFSRIRLFYSAVITCSISSVPMTSLVREIGCNKNYSLYSDFFQVSSVTFSLEVFLFVLGGIILLCSSNSLRSLFSPSTNQESSKVMSSLNKSSSSTYLIDLSIPSSFHKTPILTLVSNYMPKEYPLIILFTTLGASFLMSRRDLVSIYLSLELQSFRVYILRRIYRNSESRTRRGLKYFLLGALSSAFILLGRSFVYGSTGLTQFRGLEIFFSLSNPLSLDKVARVYPTFQGRSDLMDPLLISGYVSLRSRIKGFILGFFLISAGFLFKVRAAPFHN